MIQLYTVEYKIMGQFYKKTVSIERNEDMHYVFRNRETNKLFMLDKKRIIDIRKAGRLDSVEVFV